MAKDKAQADTVRALLQLYPRTHMQDAGIDVADKPAALFRVLCASLLFSARISGDLATAASRALADAGWTTPQKLADSSWEQRAKVLNEAGYARYDERTARMLGEAVALLQERYGGDLRRLRKAAGGDPQGIQGLLTDFKGIGKVGAAIFCREVQAVWPELHPFADDRALSAAEKLDLGSDADALTGTVDREDFPSLLSALVRVAADDDFDRVRAVARGEVARASVGQARAGAAARASEATRKELYEQAKRLDVPGRSKMNKAELAKAVQAA